MVAGGVVEESHEAVFHLRAPSLTLETLGLDYSSLPKAPRELPITM